MKPGENSKISKLKLKELSLLRERRTSLSEKNKESSVRKNGESKEKSNKRKTRKSHTELKLVRLHLIKLYKFSLELCELLIKYCNKISPVVEEATESVDKKDKTQIIEEALQSTEWKATKGQYITSRKEQVDDFFAGKGKKKGQKKAQAPKTEENAAQSINHQIETLNYFDEIKVAPPLFTDKLPATLKILTEKKAYFEKLSEEAIQADEARKNLSEEERKKLDEEEKQKKEKEHVYHFAIYVINYYFSKEEKMKREMLPSQSSI